MATEQQADLPLVDEVEQLLLSMLNHEVVHDYSFPDKSELGLSGQDLADYDKVVRAQSETRKRRMSPRKEAVSGLLARLRERWGQRLELLAHRAMVDPYNCRWLCNGSSRFVVGSALIGICEWGCAGCCRGALAQLSLIRANVEQKSAPKSESKGPERNLLIHTRAGKLRKPAHDLLNALPGPGESASPRSWDRIADEARLSRDTVRKISRSLQEAGLVEQDSRGTWRRTGQPTG